jgi:hypothetical protein
LDGRQKSSSLRQTPPATANLKAAHAQSNLKLVIDTERDAGLNQQRHPLMRSTAELACPPPQLLIARPGSLHVKQVTPRQVRVCRRRRDAMVFIKGAVSNAGPV